MKRAAFTKHVLLALGLGVVMAACGGSDNPPPAQVGWTDIQKDMVMLCATSAACHAKGATNKFVIDTAAMDMTNYMNVLNGTTSAGAVKFINPQAPAMSAIIQKGKGMLGHGAGPQLPAATEQKWLGWIMKGAAFPPM